MRFSRLKCREIRTDLAGVKFKVIEAKKNQRADALKEVKRLCKEFGFTAGMLKGSLAKRRETKKTNTVISLFSGAGGMDIGFKNGGFKTVVAVEQDVSCCDTLRTNFPNMPVIEGDIADITSDEILKQAKLQPLECDVVIGGPPCQSFSLAGKRMGMDDPRGKLLLEYVRVVRETLPKVFVLENVKGMANWAGGKAIDAIVNEFSEPFSYNNSEYYYEITYKVLRASDFGVPQHRERLIMVGNRIGSKFKFPEPTHHSIDDKSQDLFKKNLKPYATVREAIFKLPPVSPPSEMAQRISGTIKKRIEKHGY